MPGDRHSDMDRFNRPRPDYDLVSGIANSM